MKKNENLKSKKIPIYQIIKIVFQIVFFITLPGLFINAFAGIKEIYTSVINQTFQINASLPVLFQVLSVILLTILMGRFFCSWMCAFGSFGDFLYYISQKVFHIKFRISDKADRVLKYLKYVVLIFIVIGVWTLDLTVFGSVNPMDVFGCLAHIKGIFSVHYVLSEMLIGCIALLIIIIGSLFVERFYCRYICPLGAVFALISPLRIFKIKKVRGNCGSCNFCTKSCKMGIPMYKSDKVSSGECIQCFKCIPVCPRRNTMVVAGRREFSALAVGMLAIVSLTSLYFGGSLFTNFPMRETVAVSENLNSTIEDEMIDSSSGDVAVISEETISDAEVESESATTDTTTDTQANAQTDTQSQGYTDGTYEGSGAAFRGSTTIVNVKITNGNIADIGVVSYGDDDPYFEKAYSFVSSQIIDNQTTEVDMVSGATYSSNGIKAAVEDALSKAQ